MNYKHSCDIIKNFLLLDEDFFFIYLILFSLSCINELYVIMISEFLCKGQEKIRNLKLHKYNNDINNNNILVNSG